MSASHPRAARRPALWHMLLLWASTAASGEPTPSRLPRLVVDPSPPASSLLVWTDGRRLSGNLTGADGEHLRWRSGLFAETMQVQRSAVSRLDFPGTPPAAREDFRFLFVDGSHLTGHLDSFDQETLSLTSTACGSVRVRRNQVMAVERLHGPGMQLAGPATWLHGQSKSRGRFEKQAPAMATGGRAIFHEFNAAVNQELALPDKCLLDLDLRFEDEPAFSLDLASGKDWISLETWGDELVLVHEHWFDSAGPAPIKDDGLIKLRLGWDRAARRATLFANSGEPLAELEVEGAPRDPVEVLKPRVGSHGLMRMVLASLHHSLKERTTLIRGGRSEGITLTNRGAGFSVERFQVTTWSGEPPPAVITEGDALQTSSQWIAGEALSCEGNTVTVRQAGISPHQVPLADVRTIRWSNAEQQASSVRAQAEIWLHDGSLLRGKLINASQHDLRIATSIANDAVVISLKACRALILPAAEDRPAWDLANMDVIAAGEDVLHGTLRSAEDILPAFHPVGCAAALVPAPRADLTLTRGFSPDVRFDRSPVLMYTTEREALPADTFEFKGESARFTWEHASEEELPTSTLHAVQFPDHDAGLQNGFEDARWEFLGKLDSPPEQKDGTLILQPGTGIGHPYLLQGAGFQFDFSRESQITSLRIRLFCHGTERNSNALSFLVAHYGRQIHGGKERAQDGRLESSRSIEVDGDTSSASVAFRFSGGQVELLVNDISFAKVPFENDPDLRSGAGLVIETSSVWGNQIGPAKLSNFRIKSSPSLVGPPSFSTAAQKECLLLPRLRREPPPSHILLGRNGDLLRGNVHAMTDGQLTLRAGINNLEIPRERLAALVWVAEPDREMEENVKKPAEENDTSEPHPNASVPAQPKPAEENVSDPAPQWLDLTNGARIHLQVSRWHETHVEGRNPLLGACRIPLELVYRLSLNQPPSEGALSVLSGWQFEKTVDPKPPGLDEVDVSPLVGQAAPDFKLPMLDGREFSLSAQRGRVVVLDFWATWCVPCVRSLPALSRAMADFPANQVTFLTINEGETNARVQRFLETRDLQVPVAFDPDLEIGRRYEAEAIPYNVVIDATGTVAHVSMGSGPEEQEKIVAAVARALASVQEDKPGESGE